MTTRIAAPPNRRPAAMHTVATRRMESPDLSRAHSPASRIPNRICRQDEHSRCSHPGGPTNMATVADWSMKTTGELNSCDLFLSRHRYTRPRPRRIARTTHSLSATSSPIKGSKSLEEEQVIQIIQSTHPYAKRTRAVRHYSRQSSSPQSGFPCSLSVCSRMQPVFPNHLRLLERLSQLKKGASIPVLLLFSLLVFPIESAHATSHLNRTTNILVIAEAILLQTSIVHHQSNTREINLNWSAKFSDRHWTTTLSGKASSQDFLLVIDGFNWGKEEEDLIVQYSGTGHLGDSPVLVHGRATLVRNKEANDYQAMEIEHVTRIGNNSFWGWVAFAETVVGGIVGGGAATAAATVAAASTGGLTLGVTPWIVAGGAAGGIATLVTISTGVKELTTESNDPPDPPPAQVRPEIGSREITFPNDDRVVVAMSDDGQITGHASDGPFALTGTYNIESGQASGQILVSDVP